MSRFTRKRTAPHLLRRFAVSAFVFCCIAVFLLFGSSRVQKTADDSQAESLRLAIVRSAVQCYAVEGAYPESLDYIREHYGITWNTDRYLVNYEIIGSNLMPDVTVFPLAKREGSF